MAILIDLEATCWDKNEKYKETYSEIIELSAIVTDDNFEILDIFSEFIKPVIGPNLSEFCINLTDINQHDVDNAKSFNEVIRCFDIWTLKFKASYSKFIAWGNYDEILLRKNLLMNKDIEGKACKYVFNKRFCNLQTKFEKIMCMSKGNCKLSKALSIIGEPFQGREHSGIIDVKNMLKVYRFVYSFDKPKYIEENRIFIDHINEIRKRNLEKLNEREAWKAQKRLEKEEKQKQYNKEKMS